MDNGSIRNIGSIIASLRREKGVKQEELGNAVGVSTQAVSKWECGGVPDTELLPAIADYFGVTLDALFGRDSLSTANVEDSICKYLGAFSNEQRIKEAWKLCGLESGTDIPARIGIGHDKKADAFSALLRQSPE